MAKKEKPKLDSWRMTTLVTRALEAGVQSVMFWGPPGTGKSTLAQKVAREWARQNEKNVIRMYCHPEMSEADLIGALSLTDGKTIWKPSRVLEGYKNGDVLILDELSLAPQTVLPILMALLDDREVSMIDTPIGRFEPGETFRVLVTQNHPPTSLPEPLMDRIGIRLNVQVRLFEFPEFWEDLFWSLSTSPREILNLRRVTDGWRGSEEELEELVTIAFGEKAAKAVANERIKAKNPPTAD
jgi:MoxR-like ATPase